MSTRSAIKGYRQVVVESMDFGGAPIACFLGPTTDGPRMGHVSRGRNKKWIRLADTYFRRQERPWRLFRKNWRSAELEKRPVS